jgi:hypothetical protein
MTVEIWRGGRRTEVRHLVSGRSADVLELPVSEKDRGGFGVTLTLVRDHQLVHQSASVFVPWDDRALTVAFSTFRDKLRPGDRETWRITVTSKDRQQEATAAAEVLASMYDRSLDLFAPHVPANVLSIYPNRSAAGGAYANLGRATVVWSDGSFAPRPSGSLEPDRLAFWSGTHRRTGRVRRYLGFDVAWSAASPRRAAPRRWRREHGRPWEDARWRKRRRRRTSRTSRGRGPPAAARAAVPLRTNFSENRLLQPQL